MSSNHPIIERCAHGQMWHEPCLECFKGISEWQKENRAPQAHLEPQQYPSSETERLLAGSLAIAELAALKLRLKACYCLLDVTASDCFASGRHNTDSHFQEVWRARGASYSDAANKLKELLETK